MRVIQTPVSMEDGASDSLSHLEPIPVTVPLSSPVHAVNQVSIGAALQLLHCKHCESGEYGCIFTAVSL